MKKDRDRRHYQRKGEPQRIAGLNLALDADQQKLPRNIRRVLAGVRRPLRVEERHAAFEHGVVLIEGRPSSGHPGRSYWPRADRRTAKVSQ